MKHLLLSLLLIPTLAFGQANRDVQKKASRQTANVETLTADKTLSYLDAETQLLTPSGADRIVTLPSTGVWKAWAVKIANESSSYALAVKVGANTLFTLAPSSYAEFVARTDIPSATSAWSNLSQINATTPAGAIMEFAGANCPTGWLAANGGDTTNGVSATTYPALYAAIGNNWDTGKRNDGTAAFWTAPGAGKFRTPDLRGVFRRGAGTSTDSTNANSVTVSLYGASGVGFKDSKTAKNGLAVTNNAVTTGNDSPDHSHNGVTRNFNDSFAISGSGAGQRTTNGSTYTDGASARHTHSVTSNVTLGNGDTETAPRSVGVTVCIKY